MSRSSVYLSQQQGSAKACTVKKKTSVETRPPTSLSALGIDSLANFIDAVGQGIFASIRGYV